MERKEMLKSCWRPYMEIYYKHPRMDKPILCLLIEIDFDEEIMTLQPLFAEEYVKQDFIANIQNCSIPKKKMKVETFNGKKVNNAKELPEYEGSTNRFNPYFIYENINPDKAS